MVCKQDIFFHTTGVAGIMPKEKPLSNFFLSLQVKKVISSLRNYCDKFLSL